MNVADQLLLELVTNQYNNRSLCQPVSC